MANFHLYHPVDKYNRYYQLNYIFINLEHKYNIYDKIIIRIKIIIIKNHLPHIYWKIAPWEANVLQFYNDSSPHCISMVLAKYLVIDLLSKLCQLMKGGVKSEWPFYCASLCIALFRKIWHMAYRLFWCKFILKSKHLWKSFPFISKLHMSMILKYTKAMAFTEF